MVIHPNDRVAHLLARDERLLDVLIAASPEFERLRNPAMRRIMGRLVTIEQAARIAGVDLDELLRRLNGEAGEPPVPQRVETPSPSESPPESPPQALRDLGPERLIELDVREDLRQGKEPFSRIMAARKSLPDGAVLRLRATFEPVPLYGVMGQQGFAHWTERLADDDWRVWFYRSTDFPSTAARDADNGGRAAGTGERDARGDDRKAARGADRVATDGSIASTSQTHVVPMEEDAGIVVLDVRGLEPPEPMVRTLAALEALPLGATLLQINVRVPEFLLPRLEQLGFEYEVRRQGPDLVRVFIRRGDARPATDSTGATRGASSQEINP